MRNFKNSIYNNTIFMNKKPNSLINQKSPYLLQHAYNPVYWFTWQEEAFNKAEKEDKPVFLSIGYSTCHWCHVMEHESFEDEEIAGMMNDAFISIKVDREERPDIDGIYMTVCQMLTGGGGWPLTIIMTPDKKPFFAGTYFPKQSRFGRIGMTELIPRIKDLWETKREDIVKSANEITTALQTNTAGEKFHLDDKIFESAYSYFKNSYDDHNGGFGNAPKFPTPHNLMFLLRYWKRKNDDHSLKMASATLKKMRLGGIYDHAGYGFHRYSTDTKWLVPHFEKMLYDQAMLCMAYTEAYSAAGDKIFKNTAEEILEYVMRDLTSPEGGFFSAEDADSEGEEGKFYLWEEGELKNILGEEFELFKSVFNVRTEGNWIDSVSGKSSNTNILHMDSDIKTLAGKFSLTEELLTSRINSAREKIFEKRRQRIHPQKDDKILTDWNSLMISAFSKAYQVFGNDKYLTAAENSAGFILNNLSEANGKLFHRYRDGEAGLPAHLDDYAFLTASFIDLYEANFETAYLEKAILFNDYLLKHFWDESNGGFFFAGDDNKDLLVRQKEIYDGAVPSGNSVAMLNLLRLSRITGNTSLEEKSYSVAEAFSQSLTSSPFAFTQALAALDFALGPSFEVVISGEIDSKDTLQFLNKIRKYYIPNKILLLNDGKTINKIAPFTDNMIKTENKATLYVCRNYNCSFPTTSADVIPEIFDK